MNGAIGLIYLGIMGILISTGLIIYFTIFANRGVFYKQDYTIPIILAGTFDLVSICYIITGCGLMCKSENNSFVERRYLLFQV